MLLNFKNPSTENAWAQEENKMYKNLSDKPIAEVQKEGGRAAFIDAEHSHGLLATLTFSKDHAINIDLDVHAAQEILDIFYSDFFHCCYRS